MLPFFLFAKGHFIFALRAYIIPNGLMEFAVKVVVSSMAAALPIHSQYRETAFPIATPLYKVGK
jgi:hypothetical protein